MTPSLTACVLTLNEADHISDCLATLQWADARLVFDSLSADETAALARAGGARVVTHPFENYAAQRNAALAEIDTAWVFFVDADERCTPALAAEIRTVIANRPEKGWSVPRHNYIFGRLTRGAGWYPDYQARLFAAGAVHYENPVHEVAVVDGASGQLVEPLIHYNYSDTAHFHATQRRYNAYAAQQLQAAGVVTHPYTPYRQALRHFWWRFVTLHGYADGLHGLRLSLFMAYYEWAKYRQIRRAGSPVAR